MTYALWADVLINHASFTRLERAAFIPQPVTAREEERKLSFGRLAISSGVVETHSLAGQTPPHCPLDRPEALNSQELQGGVGVGGQGIALCR